MWAFTPASRSARRDSLSPAPTAGAGRLAGAAARNIAASRAASAGASVRIPCSVTPSARANCATTPSCSGSKPPRKPARPAPIRNVTRGALSPNRRARSARRRSASSRPATASVYATSVAIFPLCSAVSDIATKTRTTEPSSSKPVRRPSGVGRPAPRRLRSSAWTYASRNSGRCARAPTFSTSGTRRTRETFRDDLRAPRRRDARREEGVDALGRAVEEAAERLEVEGPDLDHGADLGARVHLRHAQLVNRVPFRDDPEALAGEEEQDVRARDGGEDLRDLLLVLLDPRVRDPEQEMPVLARDEAVPQQGEDGLLRDVDPLGADLPALEVEEHLQHGPRRSAIVSSYSARASTSGFHSRWVRTRWARSGVPSGAARSARASCSARWAVESGCFVPVRRRACGGGAEDAGPRLGERARVERVERVVAAFRTRALPDRRLGRRLAARRRRARARARRGFDPGPHAVHEDRELGDVLRAVGEPLPRPVARRSVPRTPRTESAHAAREQELERVDGHPDDGPLLHAVAEPLERLADEARKRERRIERPPEVRALDAERRERVGGPGMKSRRSRMYGDGRRSAASGLWSAASAQSCARVDGVATSHAERFARISRARTPRGGSRRRGRASRRRARRRAEHVHLRQAGERHDPVAPAGSANAGSEEST